MHALARQENLDEQLKEAEQLGWEHQGIVRRPRFFICADGKGQIYLSGCANFTKEADTSSVCWVCGSNRATVLQGFGTCGMIDREIVDVLPFGAIMHHVPPAQRIPDFGLHGVCRVALCGLYGVARGLEKCLGWPRGKATKWVQDVVDGARLASRTATQCTLRSEKSNAKGKVRLEATTAVYFMRHNMWEVLLSKLEETGEMATWVVDGLLWVSLCRKWWGAFQVGCRFAWQSAFFSGAALWELREASCTMGDVHLTLGFSKVLWSHLWIDHMYTFARKWRNLANFACFAMEGSHRRLK